MLSCTEPTWTAITPYICVLAVCPDPLDGATAWIRCLPFGRAYTDTEGKSKVPSLLMPVTVTPVPSPMLIAVSVLILTYWLLNSVVELSPVATSADVIAMAVVSAIPDE